MKKSIITVALASLISTPYALANLQSIKPITPLAISGTFDIKDTKNPNQKIYLLVYANAGPQPLVTNGNQFTLPNVYPGIKYHFMLSLNGYIGPSGGLVCSWDVSVSEDSTGNYHLTSVWSPNWGKDSACSQTFTDPNTPHYHFVYNQ